MRRSDWDDTLYRAARCIFNNAFAFNNFFNNFETGHIICSSISDHLFTSLSLYIA